MAKHPLSLIVRKIPQRNLSLLLLHPRHVRRYSHRSHSASHPHNPPEFTRNAPPRLPKEQQEEFERLQREAETRPTGNLAADGTELHPDFRPRTEKAEFEGETNPVTGEVGGPKTEPTRFGDWSFGGRTSDF
jgi:hypothetical protein